SSSRIYFQSSETATPSSQPLNTPMVTSPPLPSEASPLSPSSEPPLPQAVSARAATDKAAADLKKRDFTVNIFPSLFMCEYEDCLVIGTFESGLRLDRGKPVEVHGQNDYSKPRFETKTCVNAVQRSNNFATEASSADHTGDNDHGQGEHDDLVYTGHDGWHGQRQLNLAQNLARGGAKGFTSLHDLRINAANTEFGKADARSHRENDCSNHAGYDTDTENNQRRNEVNHWRHGLHEVHNRAQYLRSG